MSQPFTHTFAHRHCTNNCFYVLQITNSPAALLQFPSIFSQCPLSKGFFPFQPTSFFFNCINCVGVAFMAEPGNAFSHQLDIIQTDSSALRFSASRFFISLKVYSAGKIQCPSSAMLLN